MTHRHRLEVLAAGSGYQVQLCRTCAIVHVDVGPVTLRLRPSALVSLTEVLARASAQLQAAAESHAEQSEDAELDFSTGSQLPN